MQIRRGDRVAGETGSTLPVLDGPFQGAQPVMACRTDLENEKERGRGGGVNLVG